MSLAVRVIPCLDVDAGRVVKGVNFVDLRDAGDPVEMARVYDAEGADELTFLDITASSSGRATAAVLTATLSAPARSSRFTSSALRTPPPTVSGMNTLSAVRLTTS